MEIHLYALCWNELDILPFFFRHYDRFVSRYFIFDNASTDGSVEYLRDRPMVELQQFIPSDPASFVMSEQSLSDHCWKASRNAADWVIVSDIDEHLYHPDVVGLLRRYKAIGITLVPALGFEMISDEFPHPEEMLCETRVRGAPSGYYSKLSIFDPNAISAISYGPGRHWASPSGYLVAPPSDNLRLLHYKHIGRDRTRARYRALRSGLGAKDIRNGWDAKYSWSDEKFAQEWRELAKAAIDVHSDTAVFDFHAPPWWEPLRIGTVQGEDGCGSKPQGSIGGKAVTTQPGRASLVGWELRQLQETFPEIGPQDAESEA